MWPGWHWPQDRDTWKAGVPPGGVYFKGIWTNVLKRPGSVTQPVCLQIKTGNEVSRIFETERHQQCLLSLVVKSGTINFFPVVRIQPTNNAISRKIWSYESKLAKKSAIKTHGMWIYEKQVYFSSLCTWQASLSLFWQNCIVLHTDLNPTSSV